MDDLIAPTYDDLERAYQMPDPNLMGHQQAKAVTAGVDGITVVCSANPQGEGEHTRLIRFAKDGNLRWEQHYPSSLGAGRAIAALPDRGFVIAGDVQRSLMEYQAQMLRVDAGGVKIKDGSFGLGNNSSFSAVAVLKDGSIIAGGTAAWKGWLVCADDKLRKKWDLPVNDVDHLIGLAPLAADGFAMVASQETSTTTLGMTCLAAFTRQKQLRWQKVLPARGRGEPAGIAVLAHDDLVTVGHLSTSDHDAARLWVVRVDATGQAVWERVLGPSDEERRGRAIAPFPDGSVVVAGDALRDSLRYLIVARIAADGTVLWERTYGGGKHEYSVARGLACTDDGCIVVAGSTKLQGAGKTNGWILFLNGEGTLLWDHLLDGTA